MRSFLQIQLLNHISGYTQTKMAAQIKDIQTTIKYQLPNI